MLIGLTGGIGCGKSAAAEEFARLDFRTVDVDRVVHEEVLPDPAILRLARSRWGPATITPAGHLDRSRVAEIIFGDPQERNWWESIVHPVVGARWREKIASAPQADWVVEIPLLFEAGLEKGFDFIVCVGANPRVQRARTVARGLPAAQVERRIASQFPLAQKLDLSHAVLWNDGSRDFLRAQTVLLARRLRSGRSA